MVMTIMLQAHLLKIKLLLKLTTKIQNLLLKKITPLLSLSFNLKQREHHFQKQTKKKLIIKKFGKQNKQDYILPKKPLKIKLLPTKYTELNMQLLCEG